VESGVGLAAGADIRRLLNKNLFYRRDRAKRFYSPKTSPPDQDSLIFCRCIDYSERRGEINHPVLFGWIGSRVLMKQLAPRKKAKAPRIVFVGFSTMEMDQ
jgi:hypothetical protein